MLRRALQLLGKLTRGLPALGAIMNTAGLGARARFRGALRSLGPAGGAEPYAAVERLANVTKP